MADNQFGKYELLGRLAAGGMAEIFKARYAAAAGISKAVVIKRILPHYAANRQFITMFTNEARIVMGLSHGNIAQVFDFGEIDGDWFIAMEYVDGQPLSKVIKRARSVGIHAIPTAFAVLVSIEMLKGLHYAHTRYDEGGKALKIVHRDVSPQNVLISYEGQIKLVDFGIAKAKTAGREETESGAVKGKYSYFSPEQARAKELDARTDVFAAGIVLYEMLCGQLPFQGKMIDTMSRIVKGQFTPPRVLNPDITPALEQIILTAMAQDREKRYPTAEAFQQALSTYLYQNAPSFQPSTLGSFVQYLFEPDLVNDGRPVQLKREFLDQVSLWKKPLPHQPGDAPSTETAWGKDPSKSQSRKSAQLVPSESLYTSDAIARPPLPAKLKVALIVAAAFAAMGLAAIAASVYRTTGSYYLELNSSPTGASVFVDGVPNPKRTPLILELDASQPHMLELTYTGYRDWSRSVQKERGDKASMHAELELIAPLKSLTPEPAIPQPPKPEVEKKRPVMAVAYPDLFFKMDAKIHLVNVPASKAARLKLNPAHTYKAWTEGKASLGGLASPIWVTTTAYFIEGGPARDSFGTIGPTKNQPVTIKNASIFYAFLMDHVSEDNSGFLKVKLKDLTTNKVETLVVNAATNVIILEPQERLAYTGFNNLTTYSVRLLERGNGIQTRGEKGGAFFKVLVTQAAGFNIFDGRPVADDAVRVFELNKAYRVKGTGFMWLTIPDDGDDSDNDGQIEIEVIPGSNPLGGFKIPMPGPSGAPFGQ